MLESNRRQSKRGVQQLRILAVSQQKKKNNRRDRYYLLVLRNVVEPYIQEIRVLFHPHHILVTSVNNYFPTIILERKIFKKRFTIKLNAAFLKNLSFY